MLPFLLVIIIGVLSQKGTLTARHLLQALHSLLSLDSIRDLLKKASHRASRSHLRCRTSVNLMSLTPLLESDLDLSTKLPLCSCLWGCLLRALASLVLFGVLSRDHLSNRVLEGAWILHEAVSFLTLTGMSQLPLVVTSSEVALR